MEAPQPMQGEDLSPLLAGKRPSRERGHFTLGYDRHVFCRDDCYALMARSDGAEARLFDLQNDPDYREDLAEDDPGLASRMFEEYVIPDAGGGPPRY